MIMNQTNETITLVPLDKIIPNRYQPRSTMDPEELQTLADSIQRHDLMQKPTARLQDLDGGCYELAFGHRRFEAYKLLAKNDAAFRTMPLIVRELTNQQMFEFAWEENREREDLNPVDQGEAYITYMREFKMTSKQAGDYFHVSEETIRQKSRYTKLPEPIKDKMRAGEINENTGRAFLSMQKIAPVEAIIQAAERIEKEKDRSTPEEVVERAINNLDNVKQMWAPHMDGKPRAGYHGWLLDMKNFPNGLLPAMSEQAVGVYEKQIDHLVNPPACTACDFHTTVRGSHFCGLKICFERKVIAWQRHMVEQASKQTGIQIYGKEEDGAYKVLAAYGKDLALFQSKHKGLRLLPASHLNHSIYQDFKGLDDDLVVVIATGAALDKMNRDTGPTQGGKKTEAEKAKMRRMKVYRRLRRDLMWEFTGIAKSIFDGVPYEALLTINRWNNVLVDDQPPTKVIVADNAKVDDHKTEYQRRMLVWRLIMNDSSHYREESMADMLKDFEKRAKEWGVKIPKSLIKQVGEWDAEIKAAGARKPK